MLSALRQTLRQAWQLGQMEADACLKAVVVKNVKGAKPAQDAGDPSWLAYAVCACPLAQVQVGPA